MRAWLSNLFRHPGRGESRASAVARDVTAAQAEFRAGCEALAQSRFAEAASCFTRAVEHDPAFADAHERLAFCLFRQGDLEAAADALVLALHFAPASAGAHRLLARVRRGQGQRREAVAEMERAAALDGTDAEALNQLGAWRLEDGDPQGAALAFEEAVRRAPGMARAHSNLGCVLFRDLGEYERGAQHIEGALALSPEDPDALANYTMVLSQRGDTDGTIALCDRLLQANPELHEMRLNRALALLKQGRFAEAWPDYESRRVLKHSNFVPRPYNFPEWRGEPLAGRTLLVYGEQGIGDEIMFASCLPDVLAQAGSCILDCSPRLEALFRRSFPGATVVGVEQSDTRPAWLASAHAIDFQVALGSLPLHLRRHAADFPRHAGYLVPDPQRVAHWRARLAAAGPHPWAGFAWRGGMPSTRRTLRSMALADWLPLLGESTVRWVSLQYGDSREERDVFIRTHGRLFEHWGEAVDDLEELAALIGALDMVVSVQTATVHLAGALGKPVWVAIPAVAEWRYLERGETMPWYPSARLFRQERTGEWGPVMERIGRELPLFARGRF